MQPSARPHIRYAWRALIDNDDLNALHAEAFTHNILTHDWHGQLRDHSLGWATAHDENGLIGFVNVIWDGASHAFVEDLAVAERMRRCGVGTRLIEVAREHAIQAGCEWLHVDFEEHLSGFYLDTCSFVPTTAGLIKLR